MHIAESHVLNIWLLLLIFSATLLCLGKPLVSNAQEESTTVTKGTEQITNNPPGGRSLSKTLISADVFFSEDKYALFDLSEEGKKILREFAEHLLG